MTSILFNLFEHWVNLLSRTQGLSARSVHRQRHWGSADSLNGAGVGITSELCVLIQMDDDGPAGQVDCPPDPS